MIKKIINILLLSLNNSIYSANLHKLARTTIQKTYNINSLTNYKRQISYETFAKQSKTKNRQTLPIISFSLGAISGLIILSTIFNEYYKINQRLQAIESDIMK